MKLDEYRGLNDEALNSFTRITLNRSGDLFFPATNMNHAFELQAKAIAVDADDYIHALSNAIQGRTELALVRASARDRTIAALMVLEGAA